MASSPDRQGFDAADKSRTDQVVETAKQAATEASRAVQAGVSSATQAGAAQAGAASVIPTSVAGLIPASPAQAGSNVIRNTALDSREMANTGARLVAEAASHAVDASVAEARHAAEAAAKAAEEQRAAAPATVGDMQALSNTFAQMGQGVLKMQNAYFGLLQDAMDKARARPQRIMGCRSIPELAQVQRDLYAESVGFMLNTTTRMLQVAGEIVRDASRPLEARARHHAE